MPIPLPRVRFHLALLISQSLDRTVQELALKVTFISLQRLQLIPRIQFDTSRTFTDIQLTHASAELGTLPGELSKNKLALMILGHVT